MLNRQVKQDKQVSLLPQEQWPLTLIGLATSAPGQNPMEDVWLNGKTQIRKQAGLKTFAQVKQCFVDTTTDNTYKCERFNWYFSEHTPSDITILPV
jgi:hypothetical protein